MSEDLTRLEQANVTAISTALKDYWKVKFVPSAMFARDKLKCYIDGDNSTMVKLDRDEVMDHIASNRINPYVPKN